MNLKNNPELIPLIEWWEKDGKSTVIYLAVAAVAVAGWYGFKNYRAARDVASRNSVSSAVTTEEIEEAASKFSGMPVAVVQKIRLAKSYFDGGRYEEALATYEGMIGSTHEAFADIPVVGKAQCLEALGRFAEAQKAFEDFAAAQPKSYLALSARIGAARCLVQAEKKAEALERIKALKEEVKADEMSKMRVEQAEELIKRYVKPVPAPAVTPAPAAEKKAEAKAEQKPAEPAKK